MKINEKDFLKKIWIETYIKEDVEYSKQIVDYYFVLDVTGDTVEIVSYTGSPYNNEIVHIYEEVENEYSILVLSEKDVKIEVVKQMFQFQNMSYQRITGIRYSWKNKELIVAIPQKYYNGTEFLDIPEDFFSNVGEG